MGSGPKYLVGHHAVVVVVIVMLCWRRNHVEFMYLFICAMRFMFMVKSSRVGAVKGWRYDVNLLTCRVSTHHPSCRCSLTYISSSHLPPHPSISRQECTCLHHQLYHSILPHVPILRNGRISRTSTGLPSGCVETRWWWLHIHGRNWVETCLIRRSPLDGYMCIYPAGVGRLGD